MKLHQFWPLLEKTFLATSGKIHYCPLTSWKKSFRPPWVKAVIVRHLTSRIWHHVLMLLCKSPQSEDIIGRAFWESGRKRPSEAAKTQIRCYNSCIQTSTGIFLLHRKAFFKTVPADISKQISCDCLEVFCKFAQCEHTARVPVMCSGE